MSETQRNRYDPKGSHEDPEDDHHYRGIVCGVLDAVLPARHLVLVPASHATGDAGIRPSRPLCLRQPQHVLRPGHLRFLHTLISCGHSRLLVQEKSEFFSKIT